MKHFFYAVYILFYTGAVFMAGIFIGQMLYRSRTSRVRQGEEALGWSARKANNGPVGIGQPNIVMTGKRK